MKETAQAYRLDAEEEVTGFIKLQVDPELSGREMLEELLKAYPEGIRTTCNGIRLQPRRVAKLIRDEDCHVVYFHTLKRRFFLASELHKEVAEAQMMNTLKRGQLYIRENVFKHFNIPVRLYNFRNEIIYRHDPEARSRERVATFNALVKNNHIYTLNKN